MDFNKIEALEIEKTVNDADVALRELGDLELALVGGGCGDVGLGLTPQSTRSRRPTWTSTRSKRWKSKRPSYDADVAVRELGDLELALVGGGMRRRRSSARPSIHSSRRPTWTSTRSKRWKSKRPSTTPTWPCVSWATWNWRSSVAACGDVGLA